MAYQASAEKAGMNFFSGPLRRSPSAPAAVQLQVEQTCSPSDSCHYAIDETVPYAGTVSPAYAHRRPRPLVQRAEVPMTNPYPGSTGSDRPAFDAHLLYPHRLRLTSPTDDRQAHPSCTAQENPP